MKMRHSWNIFRFLLILFLSGGIVCSDFPVQASSGGHVYRASVIARPQTEAAATVEEKAAVVQSQKPAAKTQPAPKAQKSATSKAAPAKKTVKKSVSSPTRAASKKAAGDTTQKTAAKKTAAQKTTAKKSAPVKAVSKKATSTKKPNVATAAPASKSKAATTGVGKDLHLNVKSAILINMTTGKVYFEQNPDKTIPPASITKLLTLFLVREAMAQGKLSPTTAIPVSSKAVTTGGSRMSLRRGEKVPLSELIKGISVVSANNACVAVAEYMGKGDPSKFVSQMNAKAKTIGMNSSRFHNPNGLPATGQLSTARDLAKLSMSYLRNFPESLSVHSMTTHTYHGATHRNANSLLRTYKGVDGLKTGFVCASGYNITATAKRGNTRLVAVVLGAQNSVIRQIETTRLLDYGFKRAAMEEPLANRAAVPVKKPNA
jgi:D-alanyl-D-alanine carboxypeptidase (penicillin-binding protein 5/6)